MTAHPWSGAHAWEGLSLVEALVVAAAVDLRDRLAQVYESGDYDWRPEAWWQVSDFLAWWWRGPRHRSFRWDRLPSGWRVDRE